VIKEEKNFGGVSNPCYEVLSLGNPSREKDAAVTVYSGFHLRLIILKGDGSLFHLLAKVPCYIEYAGI
jgi:hypothetical protein